jgi:hypothetical protein
MLEDKQYYFVDESGDATFYDKKGKLIVGCEGCSPILILGLIRTQNPSELRKALAELRQSLINDEYYHEIPSFKKTVRSFHAKDDVPEIRKQVYDLLADLDFKAEFVVARKKEGIFKGKHKKKENLFYFDLVSKLFENKLHKNKQNIIYFSKKDNKTRQMHFENAIETARIGFETKWKTQIDNQINILVQTPTDETCLQIIDYMNWAVYRAFINSEMRYFKKIEKKVSLLLDIYDSDKYPASYYTRKNPFHCDKITPLI